MMKTDFTISVNVGLTPELAQLVQAVLAHLPAQSIGAYQELQPTTETTQEPEPGAPAAEQPEAEKPKELTAEDIRTAMHETRQRIEGEDYKEHTDSEAYKKYHKPLTAQFKNIAAELGAEKPSLLPADQRAEFIKRCAELSVLEDGTIGVVVPF